ncbi:MAG: amidohydrolase family protein [Deltaproteobacteria bacterium]|nr:amidohydrolase family protein [Deltaproteobacteria bacterium]
MNNKIIVVSLFMGIIMSNSCGNEISSTTKDISTQDVGTYDMNQLIDLTLDTEIDNGKECIFPCNAGEVCIDGQCVLIEGDDTSSDLSDTTIVDASYDVQDIYYDSLDSSDIPDYNEVSDTYDTSLDIGSDISTDVDIGKEEVIVGSTSDRFLLKGLILDGSEPYFGEVYIVGDKIFCVDKNCSAIYKNDVGKFTTISTNGTIMPALYDAHNHLAYNVLPKWENTRTYQNRYQWQNDSSYKLFKKPFDELGNLGLKCEMVKFAEVVALLAGTTSSQGSSYTAACINVLVRNVDSQYNGFGTDYVKTHVPSIDSLDDSTATSIINGTKNGSVKSFVIHLAEGVDTLSRNEFTTLKNKGLLLKETAIIHGTALTQSEFQEMKNVGAKLIWSPISNTRLYGATTDIKTAKNIGVEISIAPDWNPSGGKNMLEELRFVGKYNKERLNSILTDKDIFNMVTYFPAKALGMEDRLGRLAKDYIADIAVFEYDSLKGYSDLTNLGVEDVKLIFIGGKPMYGVKRWMVKIPHQNYCEEIIVCGDERVICVKTSESNTNKFNQTLTDIINILKTNYPGLTELYNCKN